MTRRVVAAALGVLLFACTRTRALELPSEPGAQTVLAFPTGGSGVLVPAALADPGPLQVVLDTASDDLSLVYLGSPLDALELEPGRPLATAGGEGTPIPTVLATFTLEDGDSTWTRAPGLASALSNFRLPRINASACVSAGRCYGLEDQDQLRCVDCFSPTEPAGPQPPMEPVFWPCPFGWWLVQTSTDAPSVCQALFNGPQRPRDCNSDQILSLELTACVAHGPACPVGDWPVPLPVADRYIGPPPAGAPAPVHATLAEALAVAAPGEHWLVARGAFDLPDLALADVTIEGSCVGGTELHIPADGRVSSSGGRIVNATLTGGTLTLEPDATLALEAARVQSATISVGADARLNADLIQTSSASWHVAGQLLIGRSVLSNYGPVATGAQARVELTSSILRLDPGKTGVILADGAQLELEAVLMLGPGTGVFAGAASSVDMAVVEARGVRLVARAEGGARLTVSKLFVNGSVGGGLSGEASDLEISDSLMREVGIFDTRDRAAIEWGSGQGRCMPDSAHVKAERVYLNRITDSGFSLLCASFEGNDLELAHIGGQSFTLLGTVAQGLRWASRDSLNSGIVAQGVDIPSAHLSQGASLQLSSLNVRRHHGEGVYMLQHADASLDAVKIDDAGYGGFVLIGGQITLVATNVELEDIGVAGRAAAVVAEGPMAEKLGSIDLSITGFEIEKSEIGVLIRGLSKVTLKQGYFRENQTVFQVENDQDPRQLLRGVRLEKNGDLGF